MKYCLFACLRVVSLLFCKFWLRVRSSYRISLLLVCWFEELVFVLPSEVWPCFFFSPLCLFFSSEKFDRLLRLREFGSNITSGKK